MAKNLSEDVQLRSKHVIRGSGNGNFSAGNHDMNFVGAHLYDEPDAAPDKQIIASSDELDRDEEEED